MSAMRWEDLETAIDTLIANPDRRHRPKHIIRRLWLESANMPAMDLLQRILLTMAQSLDPSRSTDLKGGEPIIPAAANGLLPRWSYTDLEVALSYTWSNLALEIAIARHHDCLMFRDGRLTGAATARQLMLLVNGLPTPATSRVTIAGHQHVRSAKAA
jgi:hypothetical protein